MVTDWVLHICECRTAICLLWLYGDHCIQRFLMRRFLSKSGWWIRRTSTTGDNGYLYQYSGLRISSYVDKVPPSMPTSCQLPCLFLNDNSMTCCSPHSWPVCHARTSRLNKTKYRIINQRVQGGPCRSVRSSLAWNDLYADGGSNDAIKKILQSSGSL